MCDEHFTEILQKIRKTETDYEEFCNKLEIRKIPSVTIMENCISSLEGLPNSIRINERISAEDILQKLSCDIRRKLDSIKSRKEDYTYNLDDMKKICRDEDNEKRKWQKKLLNLKEKILKRYVKPQCENCPYQQEEKKCESCIYSKIREWNMNKLIDNMSLEYHNFSIEYADESYSNKLSDPRNELVMYMIKEFQSECSMVENEIITIRNEEYFVSNVGRGEETKERLINSYWEHTNIYKDFEKILTDRLNYELDEQNISFLKENGKYENEEEKEKYLTFFETRRTKFIDYERVRG